MGSRFWGWRQSGGGARIEGTAALQGIDEIYTRQAIVTGSIAPNAERMSDILNRDSQLSVKGVRIELLGNGEAPIVDEKIWLVVDPEEILFVMPPAHVSNPQRRVHRRQHRVLLRTGDCKVAPARRDGCNRSPRPMAGGTEDRPEPRTYSPGPATRLVIGPEAALGASLRKGPQPPHPL
jgi:hypothetical protein